MSVNNSMPSVAGQAKLAGVELVRLMAAVVRAALHPHALEHGPGGRDPVQIPVAGLADVQITERPAAGEALTYVRGAAERDDYWTNGPGGGGDASREFVYVQSGILYVTTTAPRCYNIFGKTYKFSRVLIAFDSDPVGSGISDKTTITIACGTGGDTYSTNENLDVDLTGNEWTLADGEYIKVVTDAVATVEPGAELSVHLYGVPA